MKTIALAVVLIACSTLDLFAQETTKEKSISKTEEFSNKAGTLIEKQFVDIGILKGVEIKVLKVKDLVANSSYSALRFEYLYKSNYSSDTKISSIDQDELDGLIKSINALKTSVLNTTKDVYTEVTFKSRTGFEAGAYFSTDKQKWTGYLQIEKFDRNSMVFFSPDDFDKLLVLIETAKTKM